MNIKLSYKEVKFNVFNNKVMFTIPLGTSICLEKLVQFFLDNEYWIIPSLMVFLLYKIFKSRDPFTVILVSDFPSIGSRENAIKIFNRVYWFIFVFCISIIIIDIIFDLKDVLILYNININVNKFLYPLKWLLALILKTMLTYINYRTHGLKSMRFIISAFSLFILISLGIISSSEFLTLWFNDIVRNIAKECAEFICYIWPLLFSTLPMIGSNISDWTGDIKPLKDEHVNKMEDSGNGTKRKRSRNDDGRTDQTISSPKRRRDINNQGPGYSQPQGNIQGNNKSQGNTQGNNKPQGNIQGSSQYPPKGNNRVSASKNTGGDSQPGGIRRVTAPRNIRISSQPQVNNEVTVSRNIRVSSQPQVNNGVVARRNTRVSSQPLPQINNGTSLPNVREGGYKPLVFNRMSPPRNIQVNSQPTGLGINRGDLYNQNNTQGFNLGNFFNSGNFTNQSSSQPEGNNQSSSQPEGNTQNSSQPEGNNEVYYQPQGNNREIYPQIGNFYGNANYSVNMQGNRLGNNIGIKPKDLQINNQGSVGINSGDISGNAIYHGNIQSNAWGNNSGINPENNQWNTISTDASLYTGNRQENRIGNNSNINLGVIQGNAVYPGNSQSISIIPSDNQGNYQPQGNSLNSSQGNIQGSYRSEGNSYQFEGNNESSYQSQGYNKGSSQPLENTESNYQPEINNEDNYQPEINNEYNYQPQQFNINNNYYNNSSQVVGSQLPANLDISQFLPNFNNAEFLRNVSKNFDYNNFIQYYPQGYNLNSPPGNYQNNSQSMGVGYFPGIPQDNSQYIGVENTQGNIQNNSQSMIVGNTENNSQSMMVGNIQGNTQDINRDIGLYPGNMLVNDNRITGNRFYPGDVGINNQGNISPSVASTLSPPPIPSPSPVPILRRITPVPFGATPSPRLSLSLRDFQINNETNLIINPSDFLLNNQSNFGVNPRDLQINNQGSVGINPGDILINNSSILPGNIQVGSQESGIGANPRNLQINNLGSLTINPNDLLLNNQSNLTVNPSDLLLNNQSNLTVNPRDPQINNQANVSVSPSNSQINSQDNVSVNVSNLQINNEENYLNMENYLNLNNFANINKIRWKNILERSDNYDYEADNKRFAEMKAGHDPNFDINEWYRKKAGPIEPYLNKEARFNKELEDIIKMKSEGQNHFFTKKDTLKQLNYDKAQRKIKLYKIRKREYLPESKSIRYLKSVPPLPRYFNLDWKLPQPQPESDPNVVPQSDTGANPSVVTRLVPNIVPQAEGDPNVVPEGDPNVNKSKSKRKVRFIEAKRISRFNMNSFYLRGKSRGYDLGHTLIYRDLVDNAEKPKLIGKIRYDYQTPGCHFAKYTGNGISLIGYLNYSPLDPDDWLEHKLRARLCPSRRRLRTVQYHKLNLFIPPTVNGKEPVDWYSNRTDDMKIWKHALWYKDLPEESIFRPENTMKLYRIWNRRWSTDKIWRELAAQRSYVKNCSRIIKGNVGMKFTDPIDYKKLREFYKVNVEVLVDIYHDRLGIAKTAIYNPKSRRGDFR